MEIRLLSSFAVCAALAIGSAPVHAAAQHWTPFGAVTVQQTWLPEDLALVAQGPQHGAVVITEFMKDPNFVTDTRGEWLEIYNALPWRVNVEGWKLADDAGNQVTLTNGGLGMRMMPGEYLVLGASADVTQNGGVPVDFAYPSFSLGNGADQIMLVKPDGTLIDRVDYDDGVVWPDAAGRSVSLTGSLLDALQNDDGMQWCPGSAPWNGSNPDQGSPGLPNPICP